MASPTQSPNHGPPTPVSSPQSKGKLLKSTRVQRKVRSVSGPPTVSKLRTPKRESTPSSITTLDDSADELSSNPNTERNHSSEPNLLIRPFNTHPNTPQQGEKDTDVSLGLQTPTRIPSSQRRVTPARSTSTLNGKNNKPWHNDEKLHEYLQDPLKGTKEKQQGGTTYWKTSTEEKRKKEGCVYVLRRNLDATSLDNDDIPIVKVGWSKKPIYRCQKIEKTCGIQLEQVVNREQRLLLRARVAEKLAHKELAPWKHEFDCECEKNHGEYFQVSERDALEVIQRWARFCQRNPWDENSMLKSFWVKRLDACKPKWKAEEHDLNDKRWARYTQPWFWEEPCFYAQAFIIHLVGKVRRLLGFVMVNRWPLFSFAQGIYTMYAYGEVNPVLIFLMIAAVGMIMAESTIRS